MYHQLCERAKECEAHVVRLTRQLIQIPSFSLHEKAAADRVEEVLRGLEYDLVLRDRAGNVVGVVAGALEGQIVLLISHLDTIRPIDQPAWIDSPFSGAIHDGCAFGVGAADCKGGLAAQILAGRLINETRLPLRGALIVGATVAEANGSSAGVRVLMEETLPKLGLKPDLAILGEPTALAVCNEHDGWVDIDVGIQDRDSRTVRQTVELLIRSLGHPTNPTNSGSTRNLFEILESEFSDLEDVAKATVRVRRRVLAGQNVEDCLGWVQQRAAVGIEPTETMRMNVCVHRERPRLYTGVATDVPYRAEPWVTHSFESPVNRARDALIAGGFRDVPVRKWRLGRVGMGAAGGVLVNSHSIPTIAFGPGDERAAHAPNESVEVKSLVDAVFGTAIMAHSFIGVPPWGWDAH